MHCYQSSTARSRTTAFIRDLSFLLILIWTIMMCIQVSCFRWLFHTVPVWGSLIFPSRLMLLFKPEEGIFPRWVAVCCLQSAEGTNYSRPNTALVGMTDLFSSKVTRSFTFSGEKKKDAVSISPDRFPWWPCAHLPVPDTWPFVSLRWKPIMSFIKKVTLFSCEYKFPGKACYVMDLGKCKLIPGSYPTLLYVQKLPLLYLI